MASLQKDMMAFKRLLAEGSLQQAYRGLMEYIMALRTHFMKNYPDYTVSGSIYYGYMDMTYFSIVTPASKAHRLKYAVVFVYDSFRFEVWLSAANRDVLAAYREKLAERSWRKYRLVDASHNPDAVLEHVLAAEPDFDQLERLTAQIEQGVLKFIAEVEKEVIGDR